MHYKIMCGTKGEKLKMPYRDAFTGKEMREDKSTIQTICFMLMCQHPDEEFIIEAVN